MKHTIIAFLCIFSFQLNAQTWSQLGPLPSAYEARNHPITFSIGDYGYITTGAGTFYNSDFYRYDPSNDSWITLANFPGGPRSFGYGVENNGKAYVGFGLVATSQTNVTYYRDLWEYDPTTNAWTKLADCPGTGRRHPAMVATPNKIFVGCGDGTTGNLKDWWEYDIPTNIWAQRPDLPAAERHHPYFFSINDEAYVGFGHNGPNIYKDMYKYNPTSQTWTAIASLPAQGRVAGTQFSHNGKGYLLSGQGENHLNFATGEFWEYDPATNAWTSLPPHPGTARWAPGSFVIGSTVYLTSGEAGSTNLTNMKDIWKYDLPFPLSVQNVEKAKVNIFPNPANDKLTITSSDEIKDFQIFNIYGSLVHSPFRKSNSKEIIISTQTMSSGIYFVQLNSGDRKVSKQFLVRH